MNESVKKILIVTAVAAEKEAVLRGLNGEDRYEVITAGVGPAAAAASTARALGSGQYKLVISAGIGGGFSGQAPVGSVVVASSIIAADLGSETQEGFLSVDQLGFGSAYIQTPPKLMRQITEAFQAAGLIALSGPILSVSTTTGTQATADALAARVPGAAAEAMEGFGVAQAAHDCGLPVLEIRAVSNIVGPRNRDAWKIPQALQALETAISQLSEVLS